jgi:nicotinamidase-related amidase
VGGNQTHCVEGTCGADIVDELKRREGEHLIANTVRGGVELNYRTILVIDARAEMNRDAHEAELKTMNRVFADVKTTAEAMTLLAEISA